METYHLSIAATLELNLLGALMQNQNQVGQPSCRPSGSGLFTEQDRSIIEEWQPKSRFTLSGLYQVGSIVGLGDGSPLWLVHGD